VRIPPPTDSHPNTHTPRHTSIARRDQGRLRSAVRRRNIRIFQRSVAAYNARDEWAWKAEVTPDFELIPPEGWPDASDPIHGRDAAWAAFMAMERTWLGGPLELTELVGSGGQVFACQRRTVLARASRVPVEWVNWVVASFRDGRYVRAQVFLDRADALAAAELPAHL